MEKNHQGINKHDIAEDPRMNGVQPGCLSNFEFQEIY